MLPRAGEPFAGRCYRIVEARVSAAAYRVPDVWIDDRSSPRCVTSLAPPSLRAIVAARVDDMWS